MMRLILPVCLAVSLLPAAAWGRVKAEFIDGTYVLSAEACDKLKALAQGAVESINTVPWSVTADGMFYWEGGCDWSAFAKTGANRWTMTAECNDEADLSTETYEYERLLTDQFSVRLTTPGAAPGETEPMIYLKCKLP